MNAEEIARLSLEIRNLAHNAWTDKPNAECLFREIEKRALKIKELAGADTPTGPQWKEIALALVTLLRAKCTTNEWEKLNALIDIPGYGLDSVLPATPKEKA